MIATKIAIRLLANLVHIRSARALGRQSAARPQAQWPAWRRGRLERLPAPSSAALQAGYAGKEVAEQIDPSIEDHHWRNEYRLRDYYDPMIGYDEVGPAYQYGWESRAEYGDRKWEDVEPDLAHDWTNRRGKSSLDWGRARPATRDAWDRVDHNFASNPQNITHPDPMEDRGVAGAVPRTPK